MLQFLIDNAKDYVAILTAITIAYKLFSDLKSIQSSVSKLDEFKRELDDMRRTLDSIQQLVKAGSNDNILHKIERIAYENLMIHKRDAVIRELIHQPFFECSASGDLISLNDAMSDLLGRKQEQCIGYGWMSIVAEPEQERLVREWETFVRFGIEFTGTFLTVDKKRLMPYARIVRHESGEPEFIIGTIKIV